MDERPVKAHPVLSKLPDHVQRALVVTPGEWADLPSNQRLRRLWKQEGLVVHLYSGADSGFTLKRAWKQLGGREDVLIELDVVRGKDHDMLLNKGAYSGLLRCALEGKLKGVVGGPNCRTRSLLRHIPIPGAPDAPRPIRGWFGEEYGIHDATTEELEKIKEDDILAWRMVFVFMVATYMRKAVGVQRR